jgi:hypothetical protein
LGENQVAEALLGVGELRRCIRRGASFDVARLPEARASGPEVMLGTVRATLGLIEEVPQLRAFVTGGQELIAYVFLLGLESAGLGDESVDL